MGDERHVGTDGPVLLVSSGIAAGGIAAGGTAAGSTTDDGTAAGGTAAGGTAAALLRAEAAADRADAAAARSVEAMLQTQSAAEFVLAEADKSAKSQTIRHMMDIRMVNANLQGGVRLSSIPSVPMSSDLEMVGFDVADCIFRRTRNQMKPKFALLLLVLGHRLSKYLIYPEFRTARNIEDNNSRLLAELMVVFHRASQQNKGSEQNRDLQAAAVSKFINATGDVWFKGFFQAAIAARNGRQATEPDIDAGTANMSDQHDTHSQPVSSASLEFQRLVYVVRKLIALQSSTSVDQHIMLVFFAPV